MSGGGATASTVPASERAYGPLQLAHKDKEGPGVLTRLGHGRSGNLGWSPSMAGGGVRRSSVARSLQGYSGRLELTIRSALALWRYSGGQIGLLSIGGEESPRRVDLPAAAAGTGVVRGGLRVAPSIEARLLHGSGGAGVWRSGVASSA